MCADQPTEPALAGITLKIKRLPGQDDLPLPTYASQGAAGMDVRAAVSDAVVLEPGEIRRVPTGLALAVPHGYEVQVRPRSGLALRHGIGLINAPGTIDSDYRGEIGILMVNWGQQPFTIRRGDRIAQMVLSRVLRGELVETEHLDETERGPGGFGHTGIR